MASKELYRHLLEVNEPWTVERVELDMAKQHVAPQSANRLRTLEGAATAADA